MCVSLSRGFPQIIWSQQKRDAPRRIPLNPQKPLKHQQQPQARKTQGTQDQCVDPIDPQCDSK